jgi:predicted MPP superfamily phosphohydrolase
MNRRQFLRNAALGTVGAYAVVSGLSVAATNSNQAYDLEVVQREIALPGLPSGLNGLRAVQLSDMHMGRFVSQEFLEKAVRLALDQKPDLAFLTGDFVYYHADTQRGVSELTETLPLLTDKMPVYAVLGNHDYGTWDGLEAMFKKLGIQELANVVTTYQRGGDSLYLGGVGCVTFQRDDLPAVARQIPDHVPAILLCHEPDLVDQTAQTGKFALQISGHSHGGQINLPLAKGLILPEYGRKYPIGLYHVGNMVQYTNRGVGMIHVPVRVDCRPEITVFTFVSA